MYEFEEYLRGEKHLLENSVQAYMRDVNQFKTYLEGKGITAMSDAGNVQILGFMMDMKEAGKSKPTLNRKLASLRIFFEYLRKSGKISLNPTEDIKTPRVEKKPIEYLSLEEISAVLEQPNDTVKGKRDRALLELLYATGIRAGEAIDMDMDDINLTMGFVKCAGEHSKARIIPFGGPCRKALEDYLSNSRNLLVKGLDTRNLFVNYAGRPMTRQGLWKILKEYEKGANLSIGLTPQVIRNTFAVHMLQNGADVVSIQELMGHEDITATQAYLFANKSRIKDVYDKSHPRK